MTAQQFLSFALMSGEHPAEPKLKWMVALSFLIHFIACAVLMGMPPVSSKNLYYSPVYSVDLVGLPGGGSGVSGISQKSAVEAKKPQIKLWKGPSTVETQAKAQVERSHPVLTIPAKEKNIAPKRAEPEAAVEQSAGSAAETAKFPESAGDTGSTASPSQGAGTPGPAGMGPGGPGGGGMANFRFARYYQAVYEKIYQSWTLPDFVVEKQRLGEAIVIIKIQRDGKILGAEFEKMSGNSQLDSSVLNAIRKADPLPPLPEDFREPVLEIGIRFTPPQKSQ
jgi:TolA protein